MITLLLTFSILLIWGIIIFNYLVRDKNRVLTAWSDIDVQLKRRHDLIPKLVDAVKQYAAYESATMSAITELRNQSENLELKSEISSIESQLGSNLYKLIAIAESYPELKASKLFLDLQTSLTEVENNIQFARRYYNGSVNNLNVRIGSFPYLLIARVAGFKKAQFFDFD
jgi:LemA protein